MTIIGSGFKYVTIFVLSVLVSFPTDLVSAGPQGSQKPMVYWCPDRPADQQYTAKQDPGCVPIVEEKSPDEIDDHVEQELPKRQINLDKLEGEVSRFLQRYNEFVSCCATDPRYLDDVDELERQANELLVAVRTGLPIGQVKIRGVAYAGIFRSMSQARHDLQNLKTRLEQLDEAMGRANSLDYEAAGRERRRIREEQEAIRRDIRPIILPRSARTGANIQDTSLPTRLGEASSQTSLPTSAGDNIGNIVSPDSDEEADLHPRTGSAAGLTPPTGRDVGQNPPAGFAIGSDEGPTGTSSLPSRAGPAIGDSSLNE